MFERADDILYAHERPGGEFSFPQTRLLAASEPGHFLRLMRLNVGTLDIGESSLDGATNPVSSPH